LILRDGNGRIGIARAALRVDDVEVRRGASPVADLRDVEHLRCFLSRGTAAVEHLLAAPHALVRSTDLSPRLPQLPGQLRLGLLQRYLALLRAKEADPRSVSLLEINDVFETMGGSSAHTDEGRARMLADAIAFHAAFPDALVFKYETMVAGDFAPLADHLSLDAEAMNPTVPAALRRVDRTRRAGNWRDWFRPEDVAHYRPLLADYMRRYGYDDDWAIAAEPCIRPEECSEYVLRLVRERQGTLRPAATGD